MYGHDDGWIPFDWELFEGIDHGEGGRGVQTWGGFIEKDHRGMMHDIHTLSINEWEWEDIERSK